MNTLTVNLVKFGPIERSSVEFKALEAAMAGRHMFDVVDASAWGGVPSGLHELELKHLFGNQSNGAKHRIFDFAVYHRPHVDHIVYGHYIEDISELNAVRDARATCGYCGNQEDGAHGTWCTKCRGSEHLEPRYWPLLYMQAVSSRNSRMERVLPRDVVEDVQRQQHQTSVSKVEDKISRQFEALNKKLVDAEKEAVFLRKCVANGLGRQALDNMIFYSHTNTFCFGWRTPLSQVEVDEIRGAIGDTSGVNVDYKRKGAGS